MSTEMVLLGYQQRWIADQAPVKVAEKSRRVGLTWGEAADDVLDAARAEGGMDVWYIGYNQDMGREYIETCGAWSRQFGEAASEVEEVVVEDEKGDIQAFRIRYASGRKITALSSRPSNLRGKQGKVVIDEAAFHPDLAELLKAAFALTIWGGKVRVISTHDGADNAFNQLCSDIRAGRLPDQAAAQRIIEATIAYQKGADLPFDYDHQLVFAEKNGQPAIASGWIKELAVRPDGIWGRVDWTAKAAAHIAAKEYRYLSPMFAHDKDGNVLRLAGAGLTNVPNLEITAIASQHGEDCTMDLLKILAALFGLPETSDQAAIVAHCQKLLSGFSAVSQRLGIAEANNPILIATAAQAAFGKVAKALGQPETATIDQLVTAAAQVVTTATGTPDPSKWVAMAQHQAVADELKTIKGAQIGAEVDAAIKAGKIIRPPTRSTATSRA